MEAVWPATVRPARWPVAVLLVEHERSVWAGVVVTLQALLIDAYKADAVQPSQCRTLAAAGPPWHGMILQASNGLAAAGAWFVDMWRAMLAAQQYAVPPWMRGAYHYHRVDEDPIHQGDVFLGQVDAAGGWSDFDLWPALDIEAGEQPANASAAQVIDSVEAIADYLLRRLGKRPLLYAGSYTRDLGIQNRMGCSLLWFPEWTATLDQSVIARMGWDLNSTLLWQYCGDGNAALVGYPHTTPIGKLDISVMVRANLPTADGLEWTRTHTGSQPL